jgi:GNAT superfamily N-acetyltransferase
MERRQKTQAVNDVVIADAQSDADYALARTLFEEYARSIGVDLCFQDFAAELDRLPVMYGPPSGALLILKLGGDIAGCVGVRTLRDGMCEMKRLYVRPSFRGHQFGRRLATAIAQRARNIGYRVMVLDTLASMTAAHELYLSMGFEPAPAYYSNPLPDVTYLALDLGERTPG